MLHSKRSSLFDTFVPIRIIIKIDTVCPCVCLCVCLSVFVCVIYQPLIDFPPPKKLDYLPCLLLLLCWEKAWSVLPLSWDSACLNEHDPRTDSCMCFTASEMNSVHPCVLGFTSSPLNLLSAPPPIMQVLKSLTSLSEFASNPYYYEEIMGSDSSPGYMR